MSRFSVILIEFGQILLENARFWSILTKFSRISVKNQQFFTIFRENDRNLAKFLYFLNDFFEILMIYRHICAFSRLLMSLRNHNTSTILENFDNNFIILIEIVTILLNFMKIGQEFHDFRQ